MCRLALSYDSVTRYLPSTRPLAYSATRAFSPRSLSSASARSMLSATLRAPTVASPSAMIVHPISPGSIQASSCCERVSVPSSNAKSRVREPLTMVGASSIRAIPSSPATVQRAAEGCKRVSWPSCWRSSRSALSNGAFSVNWPDTPSRSGLSFRSSTRMATTGRVRPSATSFDFSGTSSTRRGFVVKYTSRVKEVICAPAPSRTFAISVVRSWIKGTPRQ